jgi:hypothetical protein
MPSKEKLKERKPDWFEMRGWFYVPCAWPGWLVYGLGLAFCIDVAVIIYLRTLSVSDTFYGFFPYPICVFLLLEWIASRHHSSR